MTLTADGPQLKHRQIPIWQATAVHSNSHIGRYSTFPESRNKPAVSMPAGSNPPTLPLRSTTSRFTPFDLKRSMAACTSPTVFELNDLIRIICETQARYGWGGEDIDMFFRRKRTRRAHERWERLKRCNIDVGLPGQPSSQVKLRGF